MPVDRELFRAISGSFPTGVLIVATLDESKAPKGLLTQAYIGLSTDPPLMLISIDRTSRTLPALQKRRAFVINFLREGAEDLAALFASKAEDKFRGVHWQPSPEAEGSPILRDASVAYAACRVTEMREAGDHWIFIGSVEAGEVLGGTPLMYYRRTYAAWSAERPAPPVEGAR
jgi:flavin reductase (DIM6/NTAB) family NADH-FMN oxidoreductase RutF